jgi:hypothetical protein
MSPKWTLLFRPEFCAFGFLQNAIEASYPMGTRGSFPGGQSGWSVKLTTHLHLVPTSRMRVAIPRLLNTSSWRGTQLKNAQGQLYLLPLQKLSKVRSVQTSWNVISMFS